MADTRRFPLVTTITYLVVSVAWILFTDRYVDALSLPPAVATNLQTLKGLGFVAGCSLLIYILSRRHQRIRERAEAEREAASHRGLQEYRRLLDRIALLERRMTATHDLSGIYHALQAFVADSVPFRALHITRLDKVAKQRVVVYASDQAGEIDPCLLAPVPLGADAASRAILTRNVVIDNERGMTDVSRGCSDPLSSAVRVLPASRIAVPMLVDEDVTGVFEVELDAHTAYADEHVAALRMAAHLTALAMQNHDLWRQERRARQEIEASEAKLNSLIENSSDTVVLLAEDGTFLYESPAFQRNLGYSPAERPARHPRERIHPEDVERFEVALTTLRATGRCEVECRVQNAQGEWRWFETVGTNRLDDPHVRALVLNARDVTDRKHVEEALQRAKAFTEAIINHLPGAFFVFDGSLRLLEWNRHAFRIFDHSDSELAGMHPLDFFRETDRPRAATAIESALREGQASLEIDVCMKSGRLVPMLFQVVRLEVDGRAYLTGVGTDLTEMREAHGQIRDLNDQLRVRVEHLTALREIDQAINGSFDLDLTLEVLLTHVAERLDADAASILLYSHEAQELRFGAARGFPRDGLSTTRLPLGAGLAGRAALERKRITANEAGLLAADLDALPLLEDGRKVRDYVAVPLLAKGKLRGVLELFHAAATPRDETWFTFLDAVASQAAIALRDASLFERLERSNSELRLAYDTTIEGWARALDLKDEETEGHSRRVTDLTVQLAERMGMSEEELVHARRGALLHDIGKMGIPDSVLLKPGKLDAEEWALMKQHTTFAHDFLAPIAFLRPALDIPYCHHEKWNGSGYPRGLKREQIPLAARLFAVVDVYDALTNDRPYRKAWPVGQALEHIRGQAGTHFDPDAVSAFLELIGAPTTAGDAIETQLPLAVST